MMVVNYLQGQKYYPIPYAKKKLSTYIVISVLMYIVHEVCVGPLDPESTYYSFVYYGTSVLLVGLFGLLIIKVERKEFEKLPYIGKYFLRPA